MPSLNSNSGCIRDKAIVFSKLNMIAFCPMDSVARHVDIVSDLIEGATILPTGAEAVGGNCLAFYFGSAVACTASWDLLNSRLTNKTLYH